MRTLILVLILVVSKVPDLWAGESTVLFLDGARIERELAATRGCLETPLPADMIPNSLRIKPQAGCEVLRVEVGPAPPDRKRAGGLEALVERKAALSSRLADLRQKEDIFRSAARSQSGRAPRRTKMNPDPLGTIRQGTDFALARLESTQAAIRRAERELAAVEVELASTDKKQDAGGMAKVWLSRGDCRARIAFLVTTRKWSPQYDFRLSGSEHAEMSLMACIPTVERATSVSVVPLTLDQAKGVDFSPTPVTSGRQRVASYRLPLTGTVFSDGPVSTLSFTFTNSSGNPLPAGEAFGYWRGEYLGRAVFEPCPAGGTRSLVFGK